MSIIIELAQDALGWKEGEHPRDGGGKFTDGSATPSGMKEAAAEYYHKQTINGVKPNAHPSSSLKALLDKAGFQAHSISGGGNLVFHHPQSGTKLQIKKPDHVVAQQSAHWKIEHPDFEKTGKNAPPLAALLDKLIEGSKLAEAHPPVQKQKASAKLNPHKVPAGFKPVTTPSGTVVQKEPEQNEHPIHTTLSSNGYKLDVNKSAALTNQVIYEKPNGAKVKVFTMSGSWIAETPGHMTKSGSGMEALQALFAGKPGNYVNTTQKVEVPEASQKQIETQAAHAVITNYETKVKQSLAAAAPKASQKQAQAIGSYTGSFYTSINEALRKHKTLTGEMKNAVEQIDSYLDNCSIPEDVVVWRGLRGHHAESLKSIIEKGAKFKEKGFMSSSVSKDFANSWSEGLLLKVNAKKGTKGAFVKSLSHHSSENEVLFKAGHWVYVNEFDPHKGYAEVTIMEE